MTSQRLQPARGFTLLELLLVLVLLVVFASLAFPLLQKPLATQRLKRAANMVRTDWTRARSKAMTSGETLSFRYLAGSNRYVVEPYEETATSGESAPDGFDNTAATVTTNSSSSSLTVQGTLPNDVTFVEQAMASGGIVATTGDSSLEEAGLSWSPLVLFYPDGSTSDASLLVSNKHGSQIEVTLRGLTGATRLSQVLSQQEVER